MHLVGDEQKRKPKERTKGERLFKRANSVVMAVQLTCLLIVLSQVTIAVPKTFGSSRTIWMSNSFQFEDIIAAKITNCTWSWVGSFRGFPEQNLTLTVSNAALPFADLAAKARWAIIVNAIGLVVGAVNKLLFDLNLFSFVVGRVVFHKSILSFIEVVLLAMGIQACTQVDAVATILRGYLDHCDVRSQSSLPYTAPFIALYVANAFTLFMHFVTLVILFVNALGSDLVPLEEEERRAAKTLDA